MKIGYPCINNSIGCTANKTFRLKNYSKKNLIEKIQANLTCLQKTLKYNLKHNLLFFRIGSRLVPFASHPICKFNWQKYFAADFRKIGVFIKKHQMRISMHPDQFVLINALDKNIVKRSAKELAYHCQVLDAMELNKQAKVQIHIGGVYGNKKKAMERFIEQYKKLPAFIKKRLVIENDEKLYSLKDCLAVFKKTSIPIVLDIFHHQCLNNNEPVSKALLATSQTWKKSDGKLMADFSHQKKNARIGSHAEHINLNYFQKFLQQAKGLNFDIILEIKDKEKSALKAIKLIARKS